LNQTLTNVVLRLVVRTIAERALDAPFHETVEHLNDTAALLWSRSDPRRIFHGRRG
jgi:hypothetical protein